MNIAITSGYNNSKHSLAVLELLRREGVTINKCITVKTISFKRFIYYYKQLDFNELKKKFYDRLLSKYVKVVEVSNEIKLINEFLLKKNIKATSLSSFCKTHKINFISCKSLNEKHVINELKDIDLVIYTGGGILKHDFLNNVKIGVLNCHAAQLPSIRGSNSAEWSSLLNLPQANTLHFMVRKLDLGPIISVVKHNYSECDSIDKLRGKGIVYAITDIVKCVLDILSDNYSLTTQRIEEGKQYYIMHPILKQTVNLKLKAKNG